MKLDRSRLADVRYKFRMSFLAPGLNSCYSVYLKIALHSYLSPRASRARGLKENSTGKADDQKSRRQKRLSGHKFCYYAK
jgi:hypothetical protein